jgi:hypothetical protein
MRSADELELTVPEETKQMHPTLGLSVVILLLQVWTNRLLCRTNSSEYVTKPYYR